MKQLNSGQVSELLAVLEISIKSGTTLEILGTSVKEAKHLQDRLLYTTHGFYSDILTTTAPTLFKQLQRRGIISKI